MSSTSVAEERLDSSALKHKASHICITAGINPATREGCLATETVGEGPGHVPLTGAPQVPTSKRLLQVGLAIVHCLLAAGVVFGFAAIKPVLVAEGVYRDTCTREELDQGARICYQQELRLNFMFTVAAVATNVCALAVGTILDRYGPRVAGVIGSMLFALGCIGFGLSKSIKLVDPYPISYLLMALGGPFIFIPSLHLANTFPRNAGLILSMLTGAFDSSPAIFLLYRILYQSTLGPISLRNWFIAYLVVPFFIFVVQIFIMPVQSYKFVGELEEKAKVEHGVVSNEIAFTNEETSTTPGENSIDAIIRRTSTSNEIDSLLGKLDQHDRHGKNSEEDTRDKGIHGVMHGKNIRTQLSSFWFWGVAGFTIIQMTRTNYFMATIRTQYEFLLRSYEASVSINTFFDIALPLGGLAAVPFIGTFLDSFSTLTVLSTLVACATLMGLLGLIRDSYAAAYLNVLVFVAYRPFYYTVISDYCAKVFGVATFGKVYGTVICLAGLVNFSATLLDKVTLQWCDGDPRLVNALLLILGFSVGISMIVFVQNQRREARKGDKKRSLVEPEDSSVRERFLAVNEGYGTIS